MDPETQRAEAERWLGIAAKLMGTRDLIGSRTFAIRAREADPNNGVSEQILAVVDTVLAAEKRINASQQPDFYSILQLPKLVRDPELIADHYRRLLFCLSPDRNSFPFADYALQLVVEAWTTLSDPTKKWLFDNELALFLQQHPQQQQQQQQHESQQQHQQQQQQQQQKPQSQPQQQQLNTYQFFQPQPQQLSQLSQPQQQQQQQMMWQQQPQQQIHQRDFMTQVTQQQVPPQWQMRDPTPIKGASGGGAGGGGGGGGVRGVTQVAPMMPLTQATTVRAVELPVQTSVPVGRVTVAATTVVDGNAGNVPTASAVNSNANVNVNANVAAVAVNVNDSVNDNASNDVNVNVDVNGNVVVEEEDEEEEEEEEGVVEEVESFWTACPYCLYIFEYLTEYQGCALRCQNCRKVFHAVQIPNPPPICTNNGGKGKEKDEEKEKGKENSFCCWGFFPLGFSMTAWKKNNQGGNLNVSSNWVPFSPMFANPGRGGGGGFQWFGNSDENACGPIHGVAKSTPRVYLDDDDAFLDLSESTDMDSSDGDWRTYNQEKTKKKKKRGNVGGRKRGRRAKPPKSNVVKQVNQNVASGGGVSVGGENMESGSDVQEVVFSLAAGDKSTTSKSVSVSHMRKQTRRSVKDVGRLDLNVEFNNDGEEHAPAVRAVNGEEDGIENIAFFEGLDEFLSTLPILNVGGDEKAKPS